MNPLSFEYKVTIREYHTAVYFGLVTRYHTMMRIFVVVAAVALLCFAGGYIGVIPPFVLPSYLFLGYMVWLLFLLARTEHGVLKFTKQAESPLKNLLRLTFSRDTLKVETPHNKEAAIHPLTSLFLAFELSDLFLIYLDGANVLMLPTRVMSSNERLELRDRLQDHLHDRFQTRYGRGKAPKMKPLVSTKKRFF